MMKNTAAYDDWLAWGDEIRISIRAISFDSKKECLLVERSQEGEGGFINFIGGRLEQGETFIECLEREIEEETNARIARAEFLFVLENFIPFRNEFRHSVELFYEIWLDHEDIESREANTRIDWIDLKGLERVDLRPHLVRDLVVTNDYRTQRHWVVSGK
jgi:8-oxo-dGTP pyrophosphatase MutT (NUDIX family)